MNDSVNKILADWVGRDLSVAIDIRDKGSRQWPGTSVRISVYDSEGRGRVIANTFDADPVAAIQKAHVQVLSNTNEPELFDDEPA